MVVIIVDVADAIADADGDVTDRAGLRRGHAVVLRAATRAFAHLRFEGCEPRLGGAQRVLRLVELGLADGAGLDERFHALGLLPPVRDVSFGSGAVGLGARHRCLLLRGIDLDERRANADTLSPDLTKMRVMMPSTSG